MAASGLIFYFALIVWPHYVIEQVLRWGAALSGYLASPARVVKENYFYRVNV